MRIPKMTAAFISCGIALAPFSATFAAEGADEQPGAAFTGRSAAASSNCPSADWHITRQPGNKLNGVVFWNDGSGISQATGAFDPSGNFTLTLVSVQGKGPVGTVTGSRTPAKLVAAMAGEGCNKINVDIRFDEELRGARG